MVTDILSPRALTEVLELYGFEQSSYLSLYLCGYELYRGHITGVDVDVIDEGLEEGDHSFRVRMCMNTENGAEIMILAHGSDDRELLIVAPSQSSSVIGACVFGPEDLLEKFQDMIGVAISGSSQRPVQ